ncbi:hypothetical protein TcWFU_008735 [Taenia crassiceps]|uniref:Secreted protein n=1 Tax=Taenia crassiceps TaxID=6207 RepID=A0ABR4Q5G4_9CEST
MDRYLPTLTRVFAWRTCVLMLRIEVGQVRQCNFSIFWAGLACAQSHQDYTTNPLTTDPTTGFNCPVGGV